MESDKIKAALIGLAVGDALGVPVEFRAREVLKENPVTDMRAFGVHNQPAGTWSDDSSLAFCLAESLAEKGFDPADAGERFVRWQSAGYWTPHGRVFDIGIATHKMLKRQGRKPGGPAPFPEEGADERGNGNGALMRILPLLFALKNEPPAERFRKTRLIGALTHPHIRSSAACHIYLDFAGCLLRGESKQSAFDNMQRETLPFLKDFLPQSEYAHFHRLEQPDFADLPESEISSSGYVIHTLEASIWCLMTSENYEESVLKAVNLGSDTDTTGAVTGGIAGILYGFLSISENWVHILARKAKIFALCDQMAEIWG